MLKINLVPEVQQQKDRLVKINYYTMLICVVFIATTIISLMVIYGITLTTRQMIKNRENKISDLNTEIGKYKELEEIVLSLEKGLDEAKKILDGSRDWNKLLPHIEKATPKDIRFSELKLEDGLISAKIEGKDLNSIARFVQSFKNYQTVKLTGTGAVGKKSLYLTIDDNDPETITVESDGQWSYFLSFDPTIKHKVTISEVPQKNDLQNSNENNQNESINTEVNQDTESQTYDAMLNYDPLSKQITSDSNKVSTSIKKLFSDIQIKSIDQKDLAKCDVIMIFDGTVIW